MAPVYYHKEGFPPRDIDWARLVPLIGPASMALARYDGLLSAVPNAYVLLSPLTTQEAVLSSRIEGTQAALSEVLEFDAGLFSEAENPERAKDIQEVRNYRNAMNRALELLEEFPICQHVIKKAHQVLMSGVRGQNRSPGEYRRIQNWIGPYGCTEAEARFIPVNSADLPNAISQWERFVHTEYQDKLVQLAILHAEFEALHPFLDGNGRLGRMLIPLFLFKTGLLSSPAFYISAYFERDRNGYYDNLLEVSRSGDWTSWCEYFLKSVAQQANENAAKAKEILTLHDKTLRQIADLTVSKSVIDAVDFICQWPIFQGSDFVANPKIRKQTARRILNLMKDKGLLVELRPSSGRRPGIYGFRDLLNIVEGHEVF
ncbi:MAG: Fic family protein [Phycisphaerae bacterium]|nr:Fic family protein [Phycisphaerae bacterium]